MKSYETSRQIMTFFEVCAWIGFGVGSLILSSGILSIASGSPISGLFMLPTGFSLTISALMGIVLIQMSRATVDTAEYTGQILKVARDQLEVSKDARRTQATPSGYQPTQPLSSGGISRPKQKTPSLKGEPRAMPNLKKVEKRKLPAQEFVHHQGQRIEMLHGKFLYDGMRFNSLDQAHAHIDQHLQKASK